MASAQFPSSSCIGLLCGTESYETRSWRPLDFFSFLLPTWWLTSGQVLKWLGPADRVTDSLSSPPPVQNSVLCYHHSLIHVGKPPGLDLLFLGAQLRWSCVKGEHAEPTSCKAPCSQQQLMVHMKRASKVKVVMKQTTCTDCPAFSIHAAPTCTLGWCTRNSFFFSLSEAGDQAQCPEHMEKCLTTELYPNTSGEKLHINLGIPSST
jgi:hypothetical protein